MIKRFTNPPFPEQSPDEDSFFEPTKEELLHRIGELELENLKLRAVLAAYAGILAAIEQTAREHRTNLPD